MKQQITKGSTSVMLDVFIQDSSSTTGAGLTGLVYNTGSLTAYYHRNTANAAVAITLATATLGTFTSSGFIVVDGTNMPGWYQIGVPNAALITGADSVTIHLKGASNMAPLPIEIQLRPAPADVQAISADTTAPGNLALAYNGTGYVDGTAQAGAAGSITLSSGSSSTDSFYKGFIIQPVGGTGGGQAPRLCTSYTGSTKLAGVSPNWAVTPDATTTYSFIPAADYLRAIVVDTVGSYTAQQALSVILAAVAGGWTAAGTFKTPDGSTTRIASTVSSSTPYRSSITLTPSS